MAERMKNFKCPMLFDRAITGSDWLSSIRPCIYAWFRGLECLYVGSSNNGIARPFSKNHHVIALKDLMLPSDEIKLFFPPTSSRKELLEIEKLYIKELKPKYNQVKYKHEEIPLPDMASITELKSKEDLESLYSTTLSHEKRFERLTKQTKCNN